MKTIFKIILVVIVSTVSYNYFKINQSGKLKDTNHFEEFGKSTSEAFRILKMVTLTQQTAYERLDKTIIWNKPRARRH